MGACGTWAFKHVASGELKRWFCGHASCERDKCRVLFWSRRVRLISALIEKFDLRRFFTLTLDRDIIPVDLDPWDYVHRPWSKFRKRMNRKYDAGFKFVAVLEAHKNNKFPHIHGFTNVWMRQNEWSEMWQACGGGKIVWVEKVSDSGLSEYVSKSLEVAKYVGKDNLVDGYKQRGKHRSLWRSTKTQADYELTRSHEWSIIQERVYDEDGNMLDFFAKKGIWDGSKNEQERKNLEATCRALS